MPVAAAVLLHVLAAALVLAVVPPPIARRDGEPLVTSVRIELPRQLVFVPVGGSGQGGGGGGNREHGPIRHAESVGRDATTLRTAKRPASGETPASGTVVAPIVLDALPLASGTFEQIGLPVGGVSYGTSTGAGSGGGVGTGVGTGLGPGNGPGIGAGSGGGFGGGAYRPGGVVTAPRVLEAVKPRYTHDALEQKIQGTVWLDVVVTLEGRAGDVRVVQSLDPGLDEEAVSAVHRWRFAPGRMAGRPVDVLVSIAIDFSIR